MSADPSGMLFVDLTNPQSLNLYSYVVNDPLTFTDPTGLDPCEGGNNPVCTPSEENDDYPLPIKTGGQDPPPAPPPPGPPIRRDSWHPFDPEPPDPHKGFCQTSESICRVILGAILDLGKHSPWSGSIFWPLVAAGPYAAGAGGVTGAYNPATKTKCLGGGVGAQVPALGRAAQGGPLIFGKLNNADQILSGGSINVGLQVTPFLGFQVMGNSSGVLGGPTFGVPGASISITASKCKQGKQE
jgi:hypothetical protein